MWGKKPREMKEERRGKGREASKKLLERNWT
jgi:hypothetical protein